MTHSPPVVKDGEKEDIETLTVMATSDVFQDNETPNVMATSNVFQG